MITDTATREKSDTPRWIPVTVALPENDQEVFFARLGTVHRGYLVYSDTEVPVACFKDGMRYWHPGERVTHWMPSPTPSHP